MLAVCLVAAACFAAVWMPLMPNRSFRIKVLIGCFAPLGILAATAALRDWSPQVAMAYYIWAVVALACAPWGKRKETAAYVRAESEGRGSDYKKEARALAYRVVAYMVPLFIALSVYFEDF
ncbi:hypothetical protein ACX6XY_25815 [Streptomyces sp. O3]